jgi:hypothetical protein
MEASQSERMAQVSEVGAGYPLEETARMLNDRLGMYLSPSQQRTFAGVLLVGTALASAAFAWSVGTALRRSLR